MITKMKNMCFFQQTRTPPLLLLLLLLCGDAAKGAVVSGGVGGPARTSCDASYAAPCARINSEWLARDTAAQLAALAEASSSSDIELVLQQQVTEEQAYNLDRGFYPFVFDKITGTCVAHGQNPKYVGSTLTELLQDMGIGFSSSQDLQDRFWDASNRGGDWVQYMWRDTDDTDDTAAQIYSKNAFVTNVTDRYYLGVGYSLVTLPVDLPCTDKDDSYCSIQNVRSLVGKAETRLQQALSREQFEAALYDISFDKEAFTIPGGHYLFMYHYDGDLQAHAHLHRFAGQNLTQIFGELGRDPQEGANLHMGLKGAAEGNGGGWHQYYWKNKVDEPEYIKIAYNVKIVFEGESYYLGCGFNFIMGDIVEPFRSTMALSDTESSTAALEEQQDTTAPALSTTVCFEYNLPCAFGSIRQLSSHTLAHGLSSPLDLDAALNAVSQDSEFQLLPEAIGGAGGHAFLFDFNGTCVAHGGNPMYVGKTWNEILASHNNDEGEGIHQNFQQAASAGGGYILYDVPRLAGEEQEEDEVMQQRMAYIFQLTRGGRTYYGGVGFQSRQAPLYPNLDTGTRRNGKPIDCTSEFGSLCSERNSQAIVGQALRDLILASSETKVVASSYHDVASSNLTEVLMKITSGQDDDDDDDDLYRINDFYVAVFAADSSQCTSSDTSGCCVAHGGNASYVGMTWQDILDAQSITSIRGRDLHDRLMGAGMDPGGNWVEYSWAQRAGGARTKVAFSSEFRDMDKVYYVMVEYFADLPPPTCSACPGDMECRSPNQAFCELKEEEIRFHETTNFIIVMICVVGLPCLGLLFCWIGKKREERQAQAHLQQIDMQMQTMSKQIEHQQNKASRANKLVASLFPQQVHDRIMQQVEEEESSTSSDADEESSPTKGSPSKEEWNNYMKGDDVKPSSTKKASPICDLFPEATVSFADIVGFTAWSSTREPAQVFHLLETIYRRFDRIAHRMAVFKVETVGDCYVAACGLPDQRDDHAVVMARFSSACLREFKMLVQRLELELGPGTSELKIRIGMHAGPVTAGVLRGEKGRFQLFGDTVNVASRMESTGSPDRIQCSQEFVDLLLEAAKGHWVELREDRITAKGKGAMSTYWLIPSVTDLMRVGGLNTNETTDTMSHSSRSDPDPSARNTKVAANHPRASEKVVVDNLHGLVEWNVNILKGFLKQVVERRQAQGIIATPSKDLRKLEASYEDNFSSLQEVQEIVRLPQRESDTSLLKKMSSHSNSQEVIDDTVTSQLRSYIFTLANLYRNENPFHNFQHATHVTMSVVKLMSRIVATPQSNNTSKNNSSASSNLSMPPKGDNTYGITSDPLTQFAVLLSALIHDVDHPGVPNGQLTKEGSELATVYHHQSVAELNSLDLAWNLLMSNRYEALRGAIYSTESELTRFRQLMVNIVLATDIMDKDLGALRKERWNKAFGSVRRSLNSSASLRSYASASKEQEDDDDNRKATIVLEHIIQASDVAHTMQHWTVYLKWNERFFRECYAAYKAGRAEKDPCENWYQGELGFFDFYIIPLARKLKECGVFGVSSAEYLRYAEMNRKEWEIRGKEIVADMIQRVKKERDIK